MLLSAFFLLWWMLSFLESIVCISCVDFINCSLHILCIISDYKAFRLVSFMCLQINSNNILKEFYSINSSFLSVRMEVLWKAYLCGKTTWINVLRALKIVWSVIQSFIVPTILFPKKLAEHARKSFIQLAW